MKHFLKRFPRGRDRFVGIKIYPATNGCPILADALAYTAILMIHHKTTGRTK